MPYLDDSDPIVRLAGHINAQIPDRLDTGTVVAALASVLGATIDMAIEDNEAPPDFVLLRALLMHVTSAIVSTRANVMAQRES